MHISVAPLWLAATNCYVISVGRGGPGVIIDAPPEPVEIAALASEAGVVPEALLLTHAHLDHLGGAGATAAAFSIPAHLHPDDEPIAADLESQVRFLLGMGLSGEFAGAAGYQPLAHGQVVEVAGLAFRVIHTPGHTPGHCCFWVEEEGVLFSGDHLFAGSIGRTDLPGGDYGALMRSMGERILPLPRAARVLPGHGPATTLARELASNPFLQAFHR